jgi:hypothetical protein
MVTLVVLPIEGERKIYVNPGRVIAVTPRQLAGDPVTGQSGEYSSATDRCDLITDAGKFAVELSMTQCVKLIVSGGSSIPPVHPWFQ